MTAWSVLDLPDKIQDSLRAYQDGGYQDVNDYLRGKRRWGLRRLSQIQHQVDSITAGFTLAPRLAMPRTLWRGINTEALFYNRAKGDALTLDGFVSTSSSESVAMNSFCRPPGHVLLQVTVPAGGVVLPLAPLGGLYSYQQEFLLPHLTTIIVGDRITRISIAGRPGTTRTTELIAVEVRNG